MTLFKKTAVFTDMHVGLKNNSLQHNLDCLEFSKWFIKMAKAKGCETCLFLGDFHHHRSSINMQTLQFGLNIIESLSENFEQVFIIPGNHDQYYREKREIHSMEWAKHLKNVIIVNDFFNAGDVVIAPWLVGEDSQLLKKMEAKYLFGHLELPNFWMNSCVMMHDKPNDENSVENVRNFEKVFSGHFHKRQLKQHIYYIGNAFGHNYSDVGDDQRGMMVLEWGKEPEFYNWEDQPLFMTCNLSDLIENVEMMKPKMSIKVSLALNVSYEEALGLKEAFMKSFQLRDISLIYSKASSLLEGSETNIENFETIDQIVHDEINEITSKKYDKKLLWDIYNMV